MAHISEIKMAPALSANGNLKITDTVARAVRMIKEMGRTTASIQDIAFVINTNARSEYHKVTEAQVKSVMNQLAAAGKRMEMSRTIGSLVKNVDGYFYSF